MCGIVGIVGHQPVAQRLIDGLKRLEYRGYDSAGIATLDQNEICIRRAQGKLQALQDLFTQDSINGMTGIGHTRWATHGIPSEANAHPHSSDKVAVVHNGIIENYAHLKEKLIKKGHAFTSQTDTEVVVHLMTDYLNQGLKPLEALRQTLADIEGAFALVILIKGDNNTLLVARRGSPLVIGEGNGESFIGSDALVLAPWTQQLRYLEEGDYAIVTPQGSQIYDIDHHPIDRPLKTINISADAATKGGYDHFMLKEIFEQPTTVKDTLDSLINADTETLKIPVNIDWNNISKLTMIACGTSYFSTAVAKYWFEMIAKLPVEVDIASEFRYRESPLPTGGAALFISQSGETIDTLEAMKQAKEDHQTTIAIVNVPESSMDRLADYSVHTKAGPEIGVASTKAFTAQLAVLACLCLDAAIKRGTLTETEAREHLQHLLNLPNEIYGILQKEADYQQVAHRLQPARDALYLGRGTNFPIAMEGALKLKEISYIHAEGYAAGEMKHGPIALIDELMPVIVLAPSDKWMVKTLSNLQEVIARGGIAICFTDCIGRTHIEKDGIPTQIVEMPESHLLTSPILYALPMQLLSYYTATLKGTDVDQPRNLAKSVTVE
ncbi:glutamine--fructose-6-phosphate transaminase (isomerizing) [Candidatus Odyssella acanthamoebae]|uniref:Glutamine--fructose-6-phosphate aminotransferase [isomerizing] n=1 Tax=Candidatus Odyssella acanthamoebae TaxID=91604 RepID=A0A077AZX1_9PROT|nr:glutamine--fructose-6-phosphate transaminase (isomerizing) [Candidatus Paracaedibacter acanthamoebae]AIK97253.1 glucosamine--fructose-6-phosphate aminotransferase [Candidatus Paracaedibacter acanthamoebae]